VRSSGLITAAGFVVALFLGHGSVQAQVTRPSLEIPTGAEASPGFDAETATRAYLNLLPPEARERSDAYFEGGYWLLLWDTLVPTIILLAILGTGLSARMRDLASRVTRWHTVHVLGYWLQLVVLVSVLELPLTVYQGYVREHHYGLATQSFGPWLGEQLLGMGLTLVFGGVLIVVLNRVLRMAPRTWWVWGSVVVIAFLTLSGLIAPVFINPLFNDYTELDDPEVTGPILSMARANGIPASEVYVVDASRQSTRISANVSGLLGTERITLNDNLLEGTSLEEIESVMGHEMGHYVLHHAYTGLFFYSVLAVLMFAVLFRASRWGLARWGERWSVTDVADVAALPLLGVIMLWFLFLATPLTNTVTRTQEYEADIFGLNAARQPDAFARVVVRLADYRKLEPKPWEELLFFDHPSGRTRIFAAMRWKAEHVSELGKGDARQE